MTLDDEATDRPYVKHSMQKSLLCDNDKPSRSGTVCRSQSCC